MRSHAATFGPVAILTMAAGLEHQAAATFTEHGIAAAVARLWGGTATVDQAGNRLALVWLADHTQGTRSKLVINIDTGEYEQVEADLPASKPGWETARAVYLSSQNLWCAHFGNRFFEFDPDERTFTFVEPTQQMSSFALTEDKDGIIWGGTAREGAHLVSFHPQTREFVDHGPMNQETWGQKVRTLATDDHGWIYMGIGIVKGQVVAYHPERGVGRRCVPEADRDRGRGRVALGVDGHVHATAPGWRWYRLSAGEAIELEDDRMPVNEKSLPTGHGSLVHNDFPDGSQIVDVNVPNRTLTVQAADEHQRDISYDYHTPGARIYSMIKGPDGAIYGWTGHPTQIFRLDPESGDLNEEHLIHGAHINAMALQGDKLYLARYAGGRSMSMTFQSRGIPGQSTTLTLRASWMMHAPRSFGQVY